MRAVDAIMECLKAEGVDTVFGIPGGANLPTYDALYDGQIRHILCRHEQGAGHAAEGYAKASGKVGVALATSGPGATNLVTAIADAMMDSVPTVFITGQVRTELIGTDVPQDLSRADIEYEPATGPPDLPGYKPSTEGNIKQIRLAAKALANARRPVLYTGGGVINANASEELRELASSDRF